MSASTLDNALVVTITSATTADSSDGVEFTAVDTEELRGQILDYAFYLARDETAPVVLELRNSLTGLSNLVEMHPDGQWQPIPAGDDVHDEADQPLTGPAEADAVTQTEPGGDGTAPPLPVDGYATRLPQQADAAVPDSPPAAPDDLQWPDEPVATITDDEEIEEPGQSDTRRPPIQDTPWRGTTPGRETPPTTRVQPHSSSGRGPHVPAVAPTGQSRWRRHRTPLLAILGVAVVLAVVVSVGAGMLFGGRHDQSAPADPVAALSSTPATDPVQAECPSTTTGPVTTGRDPGDQTSGPNAIKAFNYGYYTWRSGMAARAVVTPNAKVGSAVTLQQYIDVLDPKVRYCLAITDTGKAGRTPDQHVYSVEHTLFPSTPGGERQAFRQNVTTTDINGKFWVTEIDSQ